MKKTLLLAIACIILAVLPTACAPANLFQAPQRPQVILPDDQAIDKLPKWFSLEYHDTNSCGETIPYKSANEYSEYENYIFDKTVVSQTINSSDSATVIYRYDLISVAIEQYEVNLVDGTVRYMLDSDGRQLTDALDPQLWLNRAYEIRDNTPTTFVTVTYSRNTDYSPAKTNDEYLEQHEQYSAEKVDIMNTYWLITSVSCSFNQ